MTIELKSQENGIEEASVFGSELSTKQAIRDASDRRTADRFPIEREVRYKVLSKRSNEEAGLGKTINMSSSGVLFTSEHALLPGKRVEVAISWPAQLNNKTALKLVARGRVVRCDNGKAALEIQQYEFRTQGTGSLQ
jgi:hypothetical protein